MRRYLIDEHLPKIYRTQLLYHEPSLKVLAIGDAGAPPRGTSDPEILKWCEQHDFILVTNDRNTMPQHLFDHLALRHHVLGVFMINLNVPMRVILDELILIAGASHEDEFLDQLVFIPLR